MTEQEEIKCIDYTNGEAKSEYLKGIEEFVKYQAKETMADSEHKSIFILAVDGEQILSTPLGNSRNIIVAIASAMKADKHIADILTLASMLFCGQFKSTDDLIKDILKKE